MTMLFSVNGVKVYSCVDCGALVADQDRERHSQSHQGIVRPSTMPSAEPEQGRPEAAATGVPVSILPPAVDASERRQTQNAINEPLEGEVIRPGPGEIVGPEPEWRTVPPAAPHGYDNTYVYADGIAHAINKSTVWLRRRGCPHCDGTGTCPRGFPLPIRCSLCHDDAVDCCTQLTEDKQHDRC